jgi:competence protein ComGC
MPQASPRHNLVTCPFCGYPYPMSDMQREVYRGRNMGCMNCGRPFKVESPPAQMEPPPTADPTELDGTGPAIEVPSTAETVEAGPGSGPAGGAAALAPISALRPNPPAVTGFICALLFFVLIAAATIVTAAAPDSDIGAGRSTLLPRTAAGILTALAIASSSLAIVFCSAGLVRTRRTAAGHGTARTGGRGIAAAGLSIGGGGLLITLVVLSTVLPVMNRQREMARREQCKANLQAIAAALAGYANSNTGHYPDSLAQLVANGTLPADALVCPSTNDTPASGPTPGLAAALAQPGHDSYVYVARGLTVATSPSNAVLLYEPAANHRDVSHVLFLDGLIVPVSASFADPLRRELDTGKNPGPTAVSLHP